MKASIAARVAILAVAVGAVAYLSTRNRPATIKLENLRFDHANRTYRINENITIWTQATNLAVKNNQIHVSATLTVNNGTGTIYEDTVAEIQQEWTRKNPRANITCKLAVEEPGTYWIWITAHDWQNTDKTGPSTDSTCDVLIVKP